MAVLGVIAENHAKAEILRRQKGIAYSSPSKAEIKHLGMVQAVSRHIDTTPEFKEALLSKVEDMD